MVKLLKLRVSLNIASKGNINHVNQGSFQGIIFFLKQYKGTLSNECNEFWKLVIYSTERNNLGTLNYFKIGCVVFNY